MDNLRQHLRLIVQPNVVWNLINSASAQCSVFVVTIILAKLLEPLAYGQYAYGRTTLLTVASITGIASGYTATRFVGDAWRRSLGAATATMRAIVIPVLLLSLVIGTGLACASSWLSSNMLGSSEGTAIFVYASIAAVVMALGTPIMGALAGLEQFRSLALAQLAGAGVAIIGAAVLGRTGDAATCMALWIAASGTVLVLGGMKMAKICPGIFAVKPPSTASPEAGIVRFQLPAALSGFILMPATWVATSILARVDPTEVGLFAIASLFRTTVLFLPGVVGSAIAPRVYALHGAGDAQAYRRLLQRSFRITVVVAGMIAVGLCLGAEPALGLVGDGYRRGTAVAITLCAVAVMECAALAVYQSMVAQRHMWTSLGVVVIPREVLTVVLAGLLIPSHGALGMSFALLGANIWYLAAVYVYFRIAGDRSGSTSIPVATGIRL